ncbi:hypothetical protein B1A99_09480 [Cohnella sp. CIP 111063]|uniref:hypothetical protein n=1 Tax=unclassified Cohnella TaxID=2636738 RepID=UPI000B8BDBC8|nr:MULTISPECIES: hypothetical protein [unclassified Cohnella]OXS59765.1 hypothetical protein B1A99_09480 [Cohnella sp. CIP 111063]PRX72558.1 hypothetical protein B0G52_105111 [Cohnella sp. SGD-V74]
MRRTLLSFIFVPLMFILLTGCYPEPQVRPTDMDQIKIELIEKSEMPYGIAYTFKLKNLSKFTIAQNNVYISYPIKTSTGSRSNEYKIEAKNNRLQIDPNEEVTLNAFAPIEGFGENQTLDTENFNVEIVGYIEEVKETRRFQKIGGLEFFK